LGVVSDEVYMLDFAIGQKIAMNSPLLTTLLYTLGFVGLAAIGLIPYRSWQVLAEMFRRGSLRPTKRVLAFFTVIVVVAALGSDLHITIRIFRCLTESYCGPSVASGWIYLAMLGTVYLAFEAAVVVLLKIERTSRSKV
jgi:hypothetical protein